MWKKVGCGSSTCFWIEPWIGKISLKVKSPILFLVSCQKNMFITDMGYWDGMA